MGTLFRFRRKHVPEVVEPLPEPEMSVIDASSDKGNEGGFREGGGVQLIEVHFWHWWRNLADSSCGLALLDDQ